MITKSKFKAELILLTSNFLSFVYRFRNKQKKKLYMRIVQWWICSQQTYISLRFDGNCSFFCNLDVIWNVQNYLNWFSELWLGPFALEIVEKTVSRAVFFRLVLLEAHWISVSYTHSPTDRFNVNTQLPGYQATRLHITEVGKL